MQFFNRSIHRQAENCRALAETIHRWRYLAAVTLWACGFVTILKNSMADESITQPLAIDSTTSLLATDASKAVYRRFNQPAAFVWQRRELRSGLTELGTALNISIWIDREVDPNQLVDYPPANPPTGEPSNPTAAKRRSLLEALGVMAESIGAEAGLVENVLLIAPTGKCARMQVSAMRLHMELHQSFPKLAAASQPFKWQELSTPNELIQNVAKQFRTKIPSDLAHDLYHAGQLANCSLATQLTLIAAGFEQEFYIAGRNQIRLRPLSDADTLDINYTTDQISSDALQSLHTKWPAVSVKSSSSGTRVVGAPGCHVDIGSLIAEKGRPGNTTSSRNQEKNHVWTFRIENVPVEQVLTLLSTNIGFELQWSDDCTAEMRSKLISVSVESAPLNALLDEVCGAANLKYSRAGNTVTVRSGP